MTFPKSAKHKDLETIYTQCSGPGGLKVAEFLGDKMHLKAGMRLLDIGTYYGAQTCFIAKEYGVDVVGIDPWSDCAEKLRVMAAKEGLSHRILALKVSVPQTGFASESFDAAFSVTTFEMIRGTQGKAKYLECLAEVLRVLRPGACFALGEPMHLDVAIPPDLVPIYTQGKGTGPEGWAKCFATVSETADALCSVGFEIMEADYAPDALSWWQEYATYDPDCRAEPEGEARIIRLDGGRWLSFGYVIAGKPR
jgi:SAM-dependent methyltransferase